MGGRGDSGGKVQEDDKLTKWAAPGRRNPFKGGARTPREGGCPALKGHRLPNPPTPFANCGAPKNDALIPEAKRPRKKSIVKELGEIQKAEFGVRTGGNRGSQAMMKRPQEFPKPLGEGWDRKKGRAPKKFPGVRPTGKQRAVKCGAEENRPAACKDVRQGKNIQSRASNQTF